MFRFQFGLRQSRERAVAPQEGVSEQTGKIDVDTFVLSVGTIDARKNQALLCRVWRLLVDRLGADRAPQLVLAGRDDLWNRVDRQQIALPFSPAIRLSCSEGFQIRFSRDSTSPVSLPFFLR